MDTAHAHDGYSRPSHFLSTREFSQLYLGRTSPRLGEEAGAKSPSRPVAMTSGANEASSSLLQLPSPERPVVAGMPLGVVQRLSTTSDNRDGSGCRGTAQRPQSSKPFDRLDMYAPQARTTSSSHHRRRPASHKKRPSRAQALRHEVCATRASPRPVAAAAESAFYDIFTSEPQSSQGASRLRDALQRSAALATPRPGTAPDPSEEAPASNAATLRGRVVQLEQKLSQTLAELDQFRRDRRAIQVHELRVELQVARSECCRLQSLLNGRGGGASRSVSPHRHAVVQAHLRGMTTAPTANSSAPGDVVSAETTALVDLRRRHRELESRLVMLADERSVVQSQFSDSQKKLQQVSALYSEAQATCVQTVAKMEQLRSEAASLKKEVQILQELPQQVVRLQRDLDEARGQVIEADRLVERYKQVLGAQANASPESIRTVATERDRLLDLLQQQKQTEAALRAALAEQNLDRKRREASAKVVSEQDESALRMDREQQYERQIAHLQHQVDSLTQSLERERQTTAQTLAAMNAEREETLVERLLSSHAQPAPPPTADKTTPSPPAAPNSRPAASPPPLSASSVSHTSSPRAPPDEPATHEQYTDEDAFSSPASTPTPPSPASPAASSSLTASSSSVASAASSAAPSESDRDEHNQTEVEEESNAAATPAREEDVVEQEEEAVADVPSSPSDDSDREEAVPAQPPTPSPPSSRRSSPASASGSEAALSPPAPAPAVEALEEHPLGSAGAASAVPDEVVNMELQEATIDASTASPVLPLAAGVAASHGTSSSSPLSSSLAATSADDSDDTDAPVPSPPPPPQQTEEAELEPAPGAAPIDETAAGEEEKADEVVPAVVEVAPMPLQPLSMVDSAAMSIPVPAPVELVSDAHHDSPDDRTEEAEAVTALAASGSEPPVTDTNQDFSFASRPPPEGESSADAIAADPDPTTSDTSALAQLPPVLPPEGQTSVESPPHTPPQDQSPVFVPSTSARPPDTRVPLFSGEEVHLGFSDVPEPLEAYSHQTSYAMAHQYSGNASFGLSANQYSRAQHLLYDAGVSSSVPTSDHVAVQEDESAGAGEPPAELPPAMTPPESATPNLIAPASNHDDDDTGARGSPSEATEEAAAANPTSLEQSPIPHDERDLTRFSGVNMTRAIAFSPPEEVAVDAAGTTTEAAAAAAAAPPLESDGLATSLPPVAPPSDTVAPPPAPSPAPPPVSSPPPLPTTALVRPVEASSGPAVVPPPPTVSFLFRVPTDGIDETDSTESSAVTSTSDSEAAAAPAVWVPPPPPVVPVPAPPPPPPPPAPTAAAAAVEADSIADENIEAADDLTE